MTSFGWARPRKLFEWLNAIKYRQTAFQLLVVQSKPQHRISCDPLRAWREATTEFMMDAETRKHVSAALTIALHRNRARLSAQFSSEVN